MTQSSDDHDASVPTTDEEPDPAVTIRRLVDGYQVSQAIHVVAVLGIADLLVDGPQSSDELAAATNTDAPSLYRVLRALATVDVLRELDDRRFELTSLGQRLRTDVEDSISGWAAYIGRPPYWTAWAELLHSVRSGENAFRHVHGTDVWSYRSTRPDENAAFDRAMATLSRRTNADLLAAYDFSPFETVADVGGGTGALLAAVLTATPTARGVLFDQEHVVAGAPALLDEFGVAQRCTIIAGSFFDGVPDGADAYTMRAVLHDWSDDDAVRILQAVRRAIPSDGTLLVVERLIGPPNEGRAAKFSDLNMLVSPGGRERTPAEFAELFERAGFRHTRVIRAGIYSYVEGRPA